jgi:serine phosphatase RsbU (regulator of sigma subunit)
MLHPALLVDSFTLKRLGWFIIQPGRITIALPGRPPSRDAAIPSSEPSPLPESQRPRPTLVEADADQAAPSLVHWMVRYAVTILLLLIAFTLDVRTGNEISSSLFYVVPVAVAAWFLGRTPGLCFAAVSVLLWLTSQNLVGVTFSKPFVLYWNLTAEAAVYFVTAWVVARVNADRQLERQLTAEVAASREVLDREARAVGRLQRELLTDSLPALPGYEWQSHYATSTRAGGDYYDAIALPDGRIAIIVADATGHGTPAAVLMATGRALFRAEMESPSEPGDELATLNRRLSRLLPTGWFLTACLVILDPSSGEIEYSLAGHEPPVIVRARTRAVDFLTGVGGPPLGPFPEARFATGSERLDLGDTLVLYTDGVTETMNAEHVLFGTEGLRHALAGSSQVSVAETRSKLLWALDAHASGAPPADDTTILLLRRTEPA